VVVTADGLPRRLIAGLVDLALAGGAFAVFAFGFELFPFVEIQARPWAWLDVAVDVFNQYQDPIVGSVILLLGLVFLTNFVSEVFWGRSPGRWITGSQIIDTRGQVPPSIGRLFLRNVVRLLGVMTLGLSWLPVLVLPSRRALHDVLSGTMVGRRAV
jgi:uncharacterized RDD family membrane protein YckC